MWFFTHNYEISRQEGNPLGFGAFFGGVGKEGGLNLFFSTFSQDM